MAPFRLSANNDKDFKLSWLFKLPLSVEPLIFNWFLPQSIVRFLDTKVRLESINRSPLAEKLACFMLPFNCISGIFNCHKSPSSIPEVFS